MIIRAAQVVDVLLESGNRRRKNRVLHAPLESILYDLDHFIAISFAASRTLTGALIAAAPQIRFVSLGRQKHLAPAGAHPVGRARTTAHADFIDLTVGMFSDLS
jgi:hypothetical protein